MGAVLTRSKIHRKPGRLGSVSCGSSRPDGHVEGGGQEKDVGVSASQWGVAGMAWKRGEGMGRPG